MYHHHALEEKYPEVGASPHQLTQYGVKIIGDQAANILTDSNRKLDLLISYIKNIDESLSVISAHLLQGKQKSVRKAIKRLSSSSIAERTIIVVVDDDEGDEDNIMMTDENDDVEDENINPNIADRHDSDTSAVYSVAREVIKRTRDKDDAKVKENVPVQRRVRK